MHFSSTLKDCVERDPINVVSTFAVTTATSSSIESTVTTLTTASKFLHHRPILVKQKPSFYLPMEDTIDQSSAKELDQDIIKSNANDSSESQKSGLPINLHSPLQGNKTLENMYSLDADAAKEKENIEHSNSVTFLDTVPERANVDDDKESKKHQIKEIENSKQDLPHPFVTRISFEDLKEEVRAMPTFPPPDFVRAGSNDSSTGCSGTRPATR